MCLREGRLELGRWDVHTHNTRTLSHTHTHVHSQSHTHIHSQSHTHALTHIIHTHIISAKELNPSSERRGLREAQQKGSPMDIISTRTVREMNMAAKAAPRPKTTVATAGVPVTGHTLARLLWGGENS